MKTRYTDMDIHFSMDGVSVYVLNIIFERFTRVIPLHSHGNGCYEVHYISCGYGKLTLPDKEYDLCPNTLYVTGPHVEHAQAPVLPDPMQEYCIYFKVRTSSRSQKHSPVMDAFCSTSFWLGQDTQGVRFLLTKLFEELSHRYTGYQNQTRLLLSQFLISIVRNYEREQNATYPFAPSNLYDSKSIIIEEYFLYEYSDSSLEGLAQRLRLSTRQTQRLLQEYYGKTFQQKKAEARMSAASVLLTQKGRSIASVAEQLGYSSAEHFSFAFKKYYHVSPARYRADKGTEKNRKDSPFFK